jgi:type I restriction enzyme S subunit
MRGTEAPQWVNVADKNAIKVQTHELIIICDGSNSGETFHGVDGVLSSTMAKISHGTEIDTSFLRYFLISQLDKYAEAKTGAAIPHLDLKGLKEEKIPVPPLPEQQRIVGILDQVFVGIAKAKANADQNLVNAKELFESELNAIFEDHPADWNVSPLRDVCKFVGGSQPPKSTFAYESKKGYVRLLQIRDYKSDAKAVYIPKELARRHCEDHDIMIGRYGPPLFQIMRGKSGAYNVALMKALPHTEILSRDFLFYFLRNRNILEYIEATADRTAGQTGFNKERLEAYTIPYPSTDKQFGVVERLHNAEAHSASLAASYVQKSNTLDSLKTSLLHEAFSGKL